METRGKWTDLIPDTGLKIKEVYDQGDEAYSPGIFSLLRKKSVTGAQENYTGKTSLDKVIQFDDGDDIPTAKRFKTCTTDVVWKNYGRAIEISKNLIEDRDFSAELDEMKDLSRSINYSIDESGCQLFNGGFATTVTVNGYDMAWYGDGQPNFSTVHSTVVPGASTQSNASSTSIALGHDNYQTAVLALQLQQQDNGLAMAMAGTLTLVVPLALEKTAKETINSDLTPESANNALNVFKGSTDIVSSIFFDSANGGSDTAWYLMNVNRSKFNHHSRQEKRLEMERNIRNKVATFTVEARWANSSLEWKGTYGSKGDLSTYSS